MKHLGLFFGFEGPEQEHAMWDIINEHYEFEIEYYEYDTGSFWMPFTPVDRYLGEHRRYREMWGGDTMSDWQDDFETLSLFNVSDF